MSIVKHLRELEARATAGPWLAPKSGPWIATLDRVIITESPALDDDIALIVALRNAAPLLLSLAEAAEKLDDATDDTDDTDDTAWLAATRSLMKAVRAMRAAEVSRGRDEMPGGGR